MENNRPDKNPEAICDYKCGELPQCAPLATSWVPMQQNGSPMYGSGEALNRGTLFPGLDLPFMDMVNKTNPYAGTPLGELMALQFVIKELQLYLDTHPDDREAFKAMQETIRLEKDGRSRYIKKYGPLTVGDLEYSSSYDWTESPWPWEYSERMGRS